MNGIGNKLRMAREAKGYTISQLAEKTRILSNVVAELEEENYTHIPAPIYGRGFVKLYAETVGLDPMECINEFMESLNATHAPASPVPQVPMAADTPATASNNGLPREPLLERNQVRDVEPSITTTAAESTATASDSGNRLSRYATPLRDSPTLGERLALIPPQLWRFALLAFAAIITLSLVFFGVRALYRATAAGQTDTPAASAPAAASTASDSVKAKERQPTLPPEIYFN